MERYTDKMNTAVRAEAAIRMPALARRPGAPLYASPWMALFLLLRREIRQARACEG